MFPDTPAHLDHPATHPHWNPPEGGGQAPAKFPIRPVDAPLDVVAIISNPRRFESRYHLHRRFADYIKASGARLTVVELAYGERPFEVTEPLCERHIRVRNAHELWHKENLINIGISRLPEDWKYVAWVDADVAFARPDWAQETIHKLQHHKVVQMFSHAHDLGPDHVPFKSVAGFMYCYMNNIQQPFPGNAYRDGRGGTYWHPGYAWAARRDAIDELGGLIDFAILGAADLHMAASLIGRLEYTLNQGLHPTYCDMLRVWEQRAETLVKRDVGYVDGTLYHFWHGKKADRKYHSRWKILVDNNYNPLLDLKRDWQGVYQLSDRSIELRDQIRGYFSQRCEDSIDL